MKEYVINGHARKIPDDNLQPGSRTCYLSHHATGNKFRIVFDSPTVSRLCHEN